MSPKIDVYAFGVVLYELISAKEAIVKTEGSGAETKGLVGLVTPLLIHQSYATFVFLAWNINVFSGKHLSLRALSGYYELQFEDALSKPDHIEDLRALIDSRLGENYPLDSVRKVKKRKILERVLCKYHDLQSDKN